MTDKQIQCLLTYLGYDPGPVDGISGPKTKAALEAFREANGVGAEGLVDAVAGTKPGDIWQESRYFGRQEFRCPCGKCGGFPVEPDSRLVKLANDVREELGVPMIIVPADGHSGGSGVRCRAYNATLKGSSPTSAHLLGKACDFSAAGASCAKIEAVLARRKSSGQIAYWYKIPGGNSYHMNV